MAFAYPSNMTSVVDLLRYSDGLTGGYFGVIILIMVAIVSFISSKSYSSEKAFGFSGFLTLLVAIILRFMNMISDTALYTVVALFVGVVIWMFVSRNQEAGV